jgi:DNA-binding NtrC family response regulator
MSKGQYTDDRDIAIGDQGRPISIGGHLDPQTQFFNYDRNRNLFLHDSFDLADHWWGMKYSGYPEQPVIVGRSAPMLGIFQTIARVAPARASVLIEGASGTGKELVARALVSAHGGPFEAVNCGLSTEGISFEDRLFGRIDKIISGASAAPGAFQLADKGTLFLDNIECLSAEQQAKLLRVLETKEVYRLGSSHAEKVDIRFVCATNHDLANLVAQNLFREDLYYRIKVVPIHLPPLCSRKEDIPLLAAYFFLSNLTVSSRRVNIVGSEALDRLGSYSWPGNVRELAHAIELTLILGDGPTVGPDEFDLSGQAVPNGARSADLAAAVEMSPEHRGDWVEKVDALLQQIQRAQTAELACFLGCSRRTVQRAVRKLVARGVVVQERDRHDPRAFWYRRIRRQV